jgi:hypothetical protein
LHLRTPQTLKQSNFQTGNQQPRNPNTPLNKSNPANSSNSQTFKPATGSQHPICTKNNPANSSNTQTFKPATGNWQPEPHLYEEQPCERHKHSSFSNIKLF